MTTVRLGFVGPPETALTFRCPSCSAETVVVLSGVPANSAMVRRAQVTCACGQAQTITQALTGNAFVAHATPEMRLSGAECLEHDQAIQGAYDELRAIVLDDLMETVENGGTDESIRDAVARARSCLDRILSELPPVESA